MSESNMMRQIMLEVSKIGTRIFRFNTGLAWAGRVQRWPEPTQTMVYPGDVVIRRAYPIHFGVEGGSDLIGWTPVNGKAVFTAIEVKTLNGKTEKERLKKQENFIQQVNDSGGIGIMAHSPEEAVEFINKRKILD